MRLPRPRLTVRRLMMVVAVAGMILGTTRSVLDRKRRFEAKRDYHAANWDDFPPYTIQLWERQRAKHLWHGFLAEKYERAARYPWLPVEADPSEPE